MFQLMVLKIVEQELDISFSVEIKVQTVISAAAANLTY